MTGDWPTAEIDHANGTRDDNRWSNLRSATRSQNLVNARKPSTNTSGLKGVSWDAERGNWRAYLTLNGRNKYLGRFADPAEAHRAYFAAARLHFGEFARTE
jgi:hypothetical protein